MITTATLSTEEPNKACKLILESVGPDDREFLTCLVAAFDHKRCIRVFKTEDSYGKHYEYFPGETEGPPREFPVKGTYLVYGIKFTDLFGDSDADLLGYIEIENYEDTFQIHHPEELGFFQYNEERYSRFEFEKLPKLQIDELTKVQ